MERLQAAIQKAKAKREGLTLPPGPTADTATSARAQPSLRAGSRRAQASEAQIAALWESLPEVKPEERVLVRNRIVAATRKDPAHVTFDMMRTKLLKRFRTEGWTSLAITSPSSECGKTFTATNLAFSFARQRDVRTMLIDLDLRRPNISKMLGMREPHSMEAVLCGIAAAEDNLVRVGDNLAIGTNHRPSPNPAELLQDSRTGEMLAELKARFRPDIIIFDLPPMLATDDVLAFVHNVDAAILVAAASLSKTEEVDICERDLDENTNMLGVVLNKCRYMPEEYNYA